MGAGQKLKELNNYKIYVKPDKTKGEREEFTRLGKKKEELLQQYDNNAERVKLDKGVLYVDGVEVDRYKSVQSLFWARESKTHTKILTFYFGTLMEENIL